MIRLMFGINGSVGQCVERLGAEYVRYQGEAFLPSPPLPLFGIT